MLAIFTSPPRESLVREIPAGDEKISNLFYSVLSIQVPGIKHLYSDSRRHSVYMQDQSSDEFLSPLSVVSSQLKLDPPIHKFSSFKVKNHKNNK